jgi:hypothetical protein
VVRLWAADFYLTLPQATRAGAAVFVADMLELLCTADQPIPVTVPVALEGGSSLSCARKVTPPNIFEFGEIGCFPATKKNSGRRLISSGV